MDSNGEDAKTKPLISSIKVEESVLSKNDDDFDDDDESKRLLLPPTRNDGISKDVSSKIKRKVHWIDSNGNNLAEIVEFQASDVSDSDEEDSDSCFCTIM